MDYNTDRERLVLPEYGRIIQNMVDYALTLEDKAERQQCAETIVKIMGKMLPSTNTMPNIENVLWDHLARMAHYKLDIDYPVEITRPEDVAAKPKSVPYPMQEIHYRHYGHLLESLLKKLGEMKEGPKRDKLILLTANQMKKDLFYWNKDALNDTKIANDLARFTNGGVQMDVKDLHLNVNMPVSGNTRGGRRRK